jgi:hypothetical protein
MAEMKVFRALAKLKSQGIIRDFRQSEPFSEADLKGIDFFVYPQKGKTIYLQVKGYSKKGKEKSYREKNRWYLLVPPRKSEEKIIREILKIIKKNERKQLH